MKSGIQKVTDLGAVIANSLSYRLNYLRLNFSECASLVEDSYLKLMENISDLSLLNTLYICANRCSALSKKGIIKTVELVQKLHTEDLTLYLNDCCELDNEEILKIESEFKGRVFL